MAVKSSSESSKREFTLSLNLKDTDKLISILLRSIIEMKDANNYNGTQAAADLIGSALTQIGLSETSDALLELIDA